jgi:imidazoleglycerol-phosphate dehydratase/histidinol-phosphatase
MRMHRYVFIDRDGTLIEEPEKPEGADPREAFPLKGASEVKFKEGALEVLKRYAEEGYRFVLVTNQPFLGTEKHPKETFDATMSAMVDELEKNGINFEFVMICPHGPDAGCDCRKPAIGGLKEFLDAEEGDIDFKNSLMFGDRDTDRQFAENLGVRFVGIETKGPFVVPQ